MSDYLKKRQQWNAGESKPIKEKKTYTIPKISEKKKKEMAEEKARLGGDDTELDKFFKDQRKKLIGICQCGCARKSSKHENEHFKSSIAHIFPKSIFESIKCHPLNWVERNFWDGCHTNMDHGGLEKWPMFADWEDIKERFHTLAPLLTDKERSHKFYSHLEKLVYE